MRVSRFNEMVVHEFGQAQGRILVRDTVLGELGHRTAEQALAEGEEARLRERGQAAIDVMERHLAGGEKEGRRTWFVGETYSIADISLYAYTVEAESIGFRVEKNVRAWLERVQGVEGWVRIRKDPTGKNPY